MHRYFYIWNMRSMSHKKRIAAKQFSFCVERNRHHIILALVFKEKKWYTNLKEHKFAKDMRKRRNSDDKDRQVPPL